MLMTSFLKRTWARALLRQTHYEDSHRQLNVLYRVRDPWGLDCARERTRFDATNRIIDREFGKVGSLLEIGCGEGLQSQYLQAVCSRLVGIDVSPIAVDRARTRCPAASFTTANILGELPDHVPRWSDLVVACEVLYYVSATRDFLDAMSRLGRRCLVTYHAPHRNRLEPMIGTGRSVQSDTIRAEGTEWIVSWWET